MEKSHLNWVSLVKYFFMINLVLFGKPGAGKGTQASFLKAQFNLIHISTGDLFRNHISNQTDLGKLAKSYMDQGDLVPDQVTIDMLENEVDQNPQAKGFIFDGFPRTEAQAEALDLFLAKKGMDAKDITIRSELGQAIDALESIQRNIKRLIKVKKIME